jgi:hypothetical protein
MISDSEVEAAVLRHLGQQRSCTMEELCRATSCFTLNQVFLAIDRLSRNGKISLRHPSRFTYLISAAVSNTDPLVRSSAGR